MTRNKGHKLQPPILDGDSCEGLYTDAICMSDAFKAIRFTDGWIKLCADHAAEVEEGR